MPLSPSAPKRLAAPHCLGALLLLGCTLAGCIANPKPEDQGPLVGIQEVLALDFSSKVTGPRLKRLERMPEVLVGELLRVKTSLSIAGEHAIATSVGHEMLRSKTVSERLLETLQAEAGRRPSNTSALWPSSFQFAQNTANGVDTLGRLLGSERHRMSEISDRVHRTDHRDQRPELSLWQRLQRRLPW